MARGAVDLHLCGLLLLLSRAGWLLLLLQLNHLLLRLLLLLLQRCLLQRILLNNVRGNHANHPTGKGARYLDGHNAAALDVRLRLWLCVARGFAPRLAAWSRVSTAAHIVGVAAPVAVVVAPTAALRLGRDHCLCGGWRRSGCEAGCDRLRGQGVGSGKDVAADLIEILAVGGSGCHSARRPGTSHQTGIELILGKWLQVRGKFKKLSTCIRGCAATVEELKSFNHGWAPNFKVGAWTAKTTLKRLYTYNQHRIAVRNRGGSRKGRPVGVHIALRSCRIANGGSTGTGWIKDSRGSWRRCETVSVLHIWYSLNAINIRLGLDARHDRLAIKLLNLLAQVLERLLRVVIRLEGDVPRAIGGEFAGDGLGTGLDVEQSLENERNLISFFTQLARI